MLPTDCVAHSPLHTIDVAGGVLSRATAKLRPHRHQHTVGQPACSQIALECIRAICAASPGPAVSLGLIVAGIIEHLFGQHAHTAQWHTHRWRL